MVIALYTVRLLALHARHGQNRALAVMHGRTSIWSQTHATMSPSMMLPALLAALFMSVGAQESAGDCRCQCCSADLCPFMERLYMSTGSKEKCTPAACSAEFHQCPDSGSHNAGSQVVATYLDCECSCCEGSQCSSFEKLMFPSGGPSFCSAEACASTFFPTAFVASFSRG